MRVEGVARDDHGVGVPAVDDLAEARGGLIGPAAGAELVADDHTAMDGDRHARHERPQRQAELLAAVQSLIPIPAADRGQRLARHRHADAGHGRGHQFGLEIGARALLILPAAVAQSLGPRHEALFARAIGPPLIIVFHSLQNGADDARFGARGGGEVREFALDQAMMRVPVGEHATASDLRGGVFARATADPLLIADHAHVGAKVVAVSVRHAVGHDDELMRAVAEIFAERLDRRAQARPLVAGVDDDRDFRRHGFFPIPQQSFSMV